ncbi:neutral zinc metallopeptidase [Nonomuraea sp. NPDC050153]|uniref:neutral zinc metallopeptidase n=1 Tax=Nonomuraea sp. NPDC050153 TaxID=3364359 RepID=UPI0037921AAB
MDRTGSRPHSASPKPVTSPLQSSLSGFALLVTLGSLAGCASTGDSLPSGQGGAVVHAAMQVKPAAFRAAPSSSPRDAALRSPLYRTSRIAKMKCEMPRLEDGNWGSMRRYMQTVSGCLDRVWAKQFAKMHKSYKAPKRYFLKARINVAACGGTMPQAGAYGTYCPDNKTYYVLAESRTWASRNGMWAAHLVAHEHGHYIQDLAGILDYADELQANAATEDESVLAENRSEDQAGCFAAAALQATRDTLPSWSKFMAMYKREKDLKAYGAWLDRGFSSGRPGSCNTWTAPSKNIG